MAERRLIAPLRLQIRLRLCGDRVTSAGRPIRRLGQELGISTADWEREVSCWNLRYPGLEQLESIASRSRALA